MLPMIWIVCALERTRVHKIMVLYYSDFFSVLLLIYINTTLTTLHIIYIDK